MRLGKVPEDEARSVLVDVLRKVATNDSMGAGPIPHTLLLQEAIRSRQVLAGQATAPFVERAEAPPSMKVAQSYLIQHCTTPPQSPDLDPSIALRLGAPQVARPFAAQYFSPPLPTSPPLAPPPPPMTATWTQRPNSAIPTVRAIPVATAVPAAGDLRSTACVPLFCREDERRAAVHQGALRRAHASAASAHRSAPDAPAVVGWTPAGWSKPAAELGGWPKRPQPTGVPPKLEVVGTGKAPVTPAVERQDVLADGVIGGHGAARPRRVRHRRHQVELPRRPVAALDDGELRPTRGYARGQWLRELPAPCLVSCVLSERRGGLVKAFACSSAAAWMLGRGRGRFVIRQEPANLIAT